VSCLVRLPRILALTSIVGKTNKNCWFKPAALDAPRLKDWNSAPGPAEAQGTGWPPVQTSVR